MRITAATTEAPAAIRDSGTARAREGPDAATDAIPAAAETAETVATGGTTKNAAAERESLSALKRPRAVLTESNRSRRTPVRETAERTRKRPAVIARAVRRR